MMFKKGMGLILILFAISSACASIIFALEIEEQGKVTNIVDGDTFDIDIGERIRLADVSAPEPDKSGGSQATSILRTLINGRTVYLDTDPKRSYERLVAVVYVKHNSTHYKNINKILLDNYSSPFYEDNHPNEFNPSTWTLYIQYYFPPPDPPDPPPEPPPMPPEGHLNLILNDENGNPLGAEGIVGISGPKGHLSLHGATNQDGLIQFYYLPPGEYKFLARREGYYNKTFSAKILAGTNHRALLGFFNDMNG